MPCCASELETNLEHLSNSFLFRLHEYQITSLIYGYRIEELENLKYKKVRYFDKLVDELGKGQSLIKFIEVEK
jgi:hypothetical protein